MLGLACMSANTPPMSENGGFPREAAGLGSIPAEDYCFGARFGTGIRCNVSMRAFFIQISIALLTLLVPEIWKDTFESLRRSQGWRWIQIAVVLWIAVVVWVSFPKDWFRWALQNRPVATILFATFGALLFGGGFLVVSYRQNGSIAVEDNSKKAPDFKATIIRYGCTRDTHELFSDVQYVNTGPTRRTVLTVALTTRAKDENGQHPFVSNPLDNAFGDELPLYVEPNQPIVKTYRYKLAGDQVGLTEIPGQVFGVLFTIINADGTMNFVTVEAMMVDEVAGTQALVSRSKRGTSLDTQGSYTPMESPFVHPPQAPPPKESLTPSAKPRFTGVERVPPPDSQDAMKREIRDSICRKINEFITKGEDLLARQYLRIYQDGEFQFSEWSKGCEEYLRDQLGEIVAKFFRSRTVVPNNPIGITAALIGDTFNYERDVYERTASCVIRLREILGKIEAGEIKPC
jgi:hypothetical protein